MIIYKITNNINGKIYIGQTVQTLKRRFTAHATKKSSISAITSAIQKYGRDNFSYITLAEYNTLTDLNEAEKYYIYLYNSLAPNGYNLRTGGGNYAVCDITRKRLSDSHKGQKSAAAKQVIDITTGFIWDSIKEAAEIYGIRKGNLNRYLNGYRKTNPTNLRLVERMV